MIVEQINATKLCSVQLLLCYAVYAVCMSSLISYGY